MGSGSGRASSLSLLFVPPAAYRPPVQDGLRQTVAVLGAGSWGVAVARHLADRGLAVRLWEFDAAEATRLARDRDIPKKLPGIRIPDSIEVTSDIGTATDGVAIVFFVTPSTAVRPTAAALSRIETECAIVVNLAKGLDVETGERMSEVIAAEWPGPAVVALMGPSHAEEVARGLPTAIVAASGDAEAAERVQEIFSTEQLRVYTSSDPIGVECGAALKNIVAIAAGIIDGLGYESTDNLKGALVTRGLAEITRMGVRMGADPETFAGLSGIGDLVTTCLSRHSRNRHVGEELGRGRSLDQILAGMPMVAEGVNTTRAALRLAERLQVDMPIAEAVGSVLFDNRSPAEALNELMARPPRPEIRR